MKTGIEKNVLIKAIVIPLILFSIIYLYTLLHEGGHALVAIIYGGRIESFVLGFSAHITQSGANFTRIGQSIFNSAGTLLPVFSLVVALKFYNRKVNNLIYHYIYAGISIAITSSLFAWVAIPIMSLFTAPPAGDDVSKFLEVSGLNPLLVSFIALLLIFLLALIIYKKGLYSKIIEYLKTLPQVEPTKLNKRQTISLVFIIVLLSSIAFMCYKMLIHDKVFETTFSINVRDKREVVKMPFTVETNKSYKMNLRLGAEGILTDVQIYDDNGHIVYQNISEWFKLSTSLDLKQGNYLFVLTFIRDPEVMMQYFEEKKYEFSQKQIDELKKILKKNPDVEYIPVSFSAVIK